MAIKIINVDDEPIGMRMFEKVVKDITDIEYLGGFTDPYQAIEFAKNHTIDAAFLDIEMPEINGIECAKKLREIDVNTQIVFVTGYDHYALNAFNVDAIGYLLKPYTKEAIQKNIDKVKRITKIGNRRLTIKTFGHFEVFIDNKPVQFSLAKSKELLAILVDRAGEDCSMEYIINLLYEDRPYDDRVKALYRQCLSQLNRTFLQHDLKDVLSINRASASISLDKIECDYLKMLNGDRNAVRAYFGEYMFEYPWSEQTVAKLDRIKKNYENKIR